MSVRQTQLAWDCPAEFKGSELIVLLKLADQANDDGECWPSQNTMAKHCRVTRETLNRTIKKLEAKNLVSIRQRFGRSSVYQLHLGCDDLSHPTCDESSHPEVGGCDTSVTGGVTNYHRGCDTSVTGGVTPASHRTVTEPSLNLSMNHTSAPAGASERDQSNSIETKVQRPHWADAQIWADWKRARKAPLTPTAWEAVERELAKGVQAGHDRNAMLRLAAEKAWRGFKFEWFLNAVNGKADSPDNAWAKVLNAARLHKSKRQQWADDHPKLAKAVNAIGGLNQVGQAQPFQLNQMKSAFLSELQGGG